MVPAGSNGPATGHGPALQLPWWRLGRVWVRKGKTLPGGEGRRSVRNMERHHTPRSVKEEVPKQSSTVGCGKPTAAQREESKRSRCVLTTLSPHPQPAARGGSQRGWERSGHGEPGKEGQHGGKHFSFCLRFSKPDYF